MESDLVVKSQNEFPEDRFHGLFSSPEADVILAAKDSVLFRVHSQTLKTTSGFFRTMYSLPQYVLHLLTIPLIDGDYDVGAVQHHRTM